MNGIQTRKDTLSSRLRFFNEEASKFKAIAKAFYLEDLIVYTAVILGALIQDFAIKLISPNHPQSFGTGQALLVFVFFGLLLRKLVQWERLRNE